MINKQIQAKNIIMTSSSKSDIIVNIGQLSKGYSLYRPSYNLLMNMHTNIHLVNIQRFLSEVF